MFTCKNNIIFLILQKYLQVNINYSPFVSYFVRSQNITSVKYYKSKQKKSRILDINQKKTIYLQVIRIIKKAYQRSCVSMLNVQISV